MRKITAAVLMSIDNTLQNLVEVLDEVGFLDNSVIFFNSDNGGDTVYTKVSTWCLWCLPLCRLSS
jgi:arylsulfatase A-like enzyme